MKIGRTRIHQRPREIRYLVLEQSEAQLLIEALDALNRETNRDYEQLRSSLVKYAYDKD